MASTPKRAITRVLATQASAGTSSKRFVLHRLFVHGSENLTVFNLLQAFVSRYAVERTLVRHYCPSINKLQIRIVHELVSSSTHN